MRWIIPVIMRGKGRGGVVLRHGEPTMAHQVDSWNIFFRPTHQLGDQPNLFPDICRAKGCFKNRFLKVDVVHPSRRCYGTTVLHPNTAVRPYISAASAACKQTLFFPLDGIDPISIFYDTSQRVFSNAYHWTTATELGPPPLYQKSSNH